MVLRWLRAAFIWVIVAAAVPGIGRRLGRGLGMRAPLGAGTNALDVEEGFREGTVPVVLASRPARVYAGSRRKLRELTQRCRLPEFSPRMQTLALFSAFFAVAEVSGTQRCLLAGMLAASSIAPLAHVVDSAITRHASGTQSLEQAVRSMAIEFVTDIRSFLSPMFWLQLMALVGNYGSANILQGIGVSAPFRIIPVTVVGCLLSMHKDVQLALCSGTAEAAPKFPRQSIVLFLLRDTMNTVSVFILPSVVAARLASSCGLRVADANVAAQVVCPAVGQLLQTWLHMFGLTFYNYPGLGVVERLALVRQQYAKSYAARLSRTAAAYCVGGTVNLKLLERMCD